MFTFNEHFFFIFILGFNSKKILVCKIQIFKYINKYLHKIVT